jgi:hypothetical protein
MPCEQNLASQGFVLSICSKYRAEIAVILITVRPWVRENAGDHGKDKLWGKKAAETISCWSISGLI